MRTPGVTPEQNAALQAAIRPFLVDFAVHGSPGETLHVALMEARGAPYHVLLRFVPVSEAMADEILKGEPK